MRGAALSEGGKPIIALPSTTSKGVSRIVQFLKPVSMLVLLNTLCYPLGAHPVRKIINFISRAVVS